MSLIATDKYSTVEGDRNDLAKSKTNLGDQWLKEAKLQWTAEIVCEFMFGVSYVDCVNNQKINLVLEGFIQRTFLKNEMMFHKALKYFNVIDNAGIHRKEWVKKSLEKKLG